MASGGAAPGRDLVDRTRSATGLARPPEDLHSLPEGSGYMSDDASNRHAHRGPRKSLNKALRQLHFLKVCSGSSKTTALPVMPIPGSHTTTMRQLCSLICLGGAVQQRSNAPPGARWFNPEELTAQKVQCLVSHPFLGTASFAQIEALSQGSGPGSALISLA